MNAVRNWALCTVVASVGFAGLFIGTGWSFETAFWGYATVASGFITLIAEASGIE